MPIDGEWMHRMWYVHHTHAMEYSSERKEMLTHAMTWKNLADITLSEVSQSQRDKYCVIPLT